MRIRGGSLAIRGVVFGGCGSREGRRHSPLFFRRQLEDVIHQQLACDLGCTLGTTGDGAGEYPMVILTPEKS